jgi:hypothetical protein
MDGRDSDPDGDLAFLHSTQPMGPDGPKDPVGLTNFPQDSFHFPLGQWLVGLVFEEEDRMSLMGIAYPAFEDCDPSCSIVFEPGTESFDVQEGMKETHGLSPSKGGQEDDRIVRFKTPVQIAKLLSYRNTDLIDAFFESVTGGNFPIEFPGGGGQSDQDLPLASGFFFQRAEVDRFHSFSGPGGAAVPLPVFLGPVHGSSPILRSGSSVGRSSL